MRDVDNRLLELKSDARRDNLGDSSFDNTSTEAEADCNSPANCTDETETWQSPIKKTVKEVNASDAGILAHPEISEPLLSANKRGIVYQFDTHPVYTSGSNRYNKETATAVQLPLISDEARTPNSISRGPSLSGTDDDSIGALIRSVAGSNRVVKPPGTSPQPLFIERRETEAARSKTTCLFEQLAVTDEKFFNVSTQLSSSTIPTGHDYRELSLFDEAGEMGNIPPKRSETSKDTKAEIRGKHLATTPSTNSDYKAGGEVIEVKSKSHTIPQVVISDMSMEQERKRFQQADGDAAMNNVKDPNELDRDESQFGHLRSSDSAYSSDSRCTSMDSTSRPDEGDFSDLPTQLYPPTVSQDSKGAGSSSSSSSSPLHTAATPTFGSDQTLRVMSDFGMQRKLSSSSGSSFR